MKNYRARLRKEGFRPIQLWTVDQNGPNLKSEMGRQVANLKEGEEKQDLAFWEQASAWPSE
mgnify:CR=1 FL=1